MDELLRRSKTSPLTICALMNFMDHEGIRLVKKALQCLDRTQTICIECSSKVAPEIRAILAAPAPLLRSFHLFSHGDGFEVDEGIFDGAMPNLQNVGLSSCTVEILVVSHL